MRRALLICAVLAVLSPDHTGAAERVWRLGVLSLADGSAMRSVVLPYLAAHGFVEGRNLHVDVRVGTEDQMPAMAAALVADKSDVIIATSDWAVHAALAATTIIPIIAAPIGRDPVLAGLADSWAHPNGNVTGVCLIAPELEVKRLSILHEALPSAHRIAVMSGHRKVVQEGFPPLRKAAASFGLELIEIWVDSPNEYPAAFDAMRSQGVQAIMVVPTPELFADSEKLGAFALKAGLPAIGGHRESAERGFLIGYGPNLKELGEQAGGYVERILGGTRAAELPFQGPTRLDFVINITTARTLGLTMPPSLSASADTVE
jgi:putative ABC transport system substrate-binding protein